MVRLIVGAIMLLLFAFVSLVRLAAPNKNDAEFILPMVWFLLLPGLVLVFLGWRARRKTPLKPQWLNVSISLICLAAPFSPFIYFAGPEIITQVNEESDDRQTFQDLVKPLVEGQVTPKDFESQVLKYVEDGPNLVRRMRRQKLAVQYLIEQSIPDTEPVIIKVFDFYGSKDLAEMLLNSGNDKLESAAKRWAGEYGYSIETTSDPGHVKWKR
jgi:predicted PurR-regulated permease PerM